MTLVAEIIGARPTSCVLVMETLVFSCIICWRLNLMCWTSTSNEIVGTVQWASGSFPLDVFGYLIKNLWILATLRRWP